MLRVLYFLVLVFLAGLGFAWLADRPGDLVVTFGGYRYQVTLMAAAALLLALVVLTMLGWWLLKSLVNGPGSVQRWFRVRRRDRGYQALSTGMIAAGAGDAELARRKKREALKLISSDSEPLLNLLDAQASLLEGDHEAARQKFEAMLKDPEMKLLGLRGLYLEAQRLGERRAARHYAAEAARVAPQLGWAAESTLEQKVELGDWDGALRLVDAQKASHKADRERIARRKAVLLTARAMAQLDADALAARNAAQEAVRLAPDLVPASVTAARALFRSGDLRKGSRTIEALWKLAPHPEAAQLYIHARPGDSAADRLERARKLEAVRPNHAESVYAMARAALEAGEVKVARAEAEKLIRLEPREGAFLLMADVEEADTGEEGRVRQWLARALRAQRDPAWVADGHVSETWAPFSPVSGRIDAYEWKAPVEATGRLIEGDRADLARLPEPEEKPAASAHVEAAAAIVDVDPVAKPPSTPAAVAQPVKAAPAAQPAAEPPPRRRLADEARADRPSAEVVLFQRPPDDPGVDGSGVDEPGEKSDPGRFRLY
ncbi:MAG: heme biosynthesis protein HemY [Rhizobiaceae bacterium]|nr:heme biosynthesis protein HemY [Rhizobiaceae bacterium]